MGPRAFSGSTVRSFESSQNRRTPELPNSRTLFESNEAWERP